MKAKEISLWLERAEDSIESAKLNFKSDLLLASINRAYYTMFYYVSALLFTQNIFTKSHTGLLNKFNELFIKSGKIDSKYSKIIHKAFGYRQTADYELEVNISEEECKILIENAEEFYSVCKKYIENL